MGSELEDNDDDALMCTAEAAAQVIEAKTAETKEEKNLSELVDVEEFLSKDGVGMLEYEKQIFFDLLHSDGLVVCAKGISYERVMLNLLKLFCDSTTLVLVVNCTSFDEKYYTSLLNSEHVHESSTNTNERERIYLEGGIQFISTRILVVDLLKKRIPIDLITGIFVVRAHNIIESCQEAFALRLYRQQNKTGFIKAFSKSAEAFSFGYGHVEKVMRNLFVKDLLIWPRFHATIQKSLKPFEPVVVEIQLPMTPKMILIQTHILDIMNYMVKDVKSLNRTIEMQEITVENCVTKKFHKILQSQLDSIWHQLSSRTKLIIADLKVLRSLVIATIYSDSVSLYATMKRYRTTEYAMSNSGWTILDSAEKVFNITKERVFNKKDEFEPEPCPKWKALSEILRVEIPSDVKQSLQKIKKKEERLAFLKAQIKVLILCQDARTCYQLNQYLTQGAEKYLFFTAMKNDITVAKLSASYKHINNQSEKDAIKIQSVGAFLQPKPATTKKTPEKTKPEETATSSAKTFGTRFLKDRLAKKKAEAAEEALLNAKEDEAAAKISDMDAELFSKDEVEDYNCFRDSYILTMSQKHDGSKSVSVSEDDEDMFDVSQMEKCEFESFPEMENLDVTSVINQSSKPIVFIQTFKSEQNGFVSLDKTLEDIKPKYLIMYHSNVTAIRQIEVFEARQQRTAKDRVVVYAIVHSKTVEEQSYLTNLRREKQAFEMMIETKRTMVVPEYQDGKSDETLAMIHLKQEASTRQAGGQAACELEPVVTPKIIVDMREFRSDLPCLIHKRGIEVVPLTITIGDYILTPEICVERKSISDLIGSLNSGRLYNQCVQMSRHYTKPILLIEFDQNKPFHLQRYFMMSGDSTPSNNDITQKLQLLTLHFPKLKLVWSPSPYATAQLFEELKLGKSEPNPEVAALLGSDDAGEIETLSEKINPNIHDFLIKLPGITSKNITKVMKKCQNLKELLQKTEVELVELLGNSTQAKMLWEILHVAHKPVQGDASDKQFASKFKRGMNRRAF